MALFAHVVTGRSNYFGIVFLKTLYLCVRNDVALCYGSHKEFQSIPSRCTRYSSKSVVRNSYVRPGF